ncbi:MAG: dephospho-CoA kinase, partial [Atribacterota bacterium]
MLIVGLTGGIVSGKTTVAQILQGLGAKIIDADKIGHQIMRPHQKVWKNIVQHFGEEILVDNQEIDRKKLGQIVFSNQNKLNLLNQITHPEIISEIKRMINQIKDKSTRDTICIVDAPLLYEANIDYLTDRTIVVYLDYEKQIKRLNQRNGLSREEAVKRIKSQIPMEEKARMADYVIDNSLSIEQMKAQV